jgi:hypothetical protein
VITSAHEEMMKQFAGLSGDEVRQLHFATRIRMQYWEEHGKAHPLSKIDLAPDDIEDFCQHVMDGGGVEDHTLLVEIMLKAVEKRDWPTLRQHLPHVLKMFLKLQSKIQRCGPDGRILKTLNSQLSDEAYQSFTGTMLPPAA